MMVQPPASPAGIKFVSLGLSMLITCNSLIDHQFLEKRVREETYFEATRGVDSYLEMVLPCAIHFHAGQLSAVADLVCQMLGMKIAIRTNNMSDSVVAAHAVRVPVTLNFSANTTAPGLFPFTSSISSSRTEVILYSNIRTYSGVWSALPATAYQCFNS